MGIQDLARIEPKGMPIDDVLDGADSKTREVLEWALRERDPVNRRQHLVSVSEIIRRCGEDGFVVTEWSIKNWRREHADR